MGRDVYGRKTVQQIFKCKFRPPIILRCQWRLKHGEPIKTCSRLKVELDVAESMTNDEMGLVLSLHNQKGWLLKPGTEPLSSRICHIGYGASVIPCRECLGEEKDIFP